MTYRMVALPQAISTIDEKVTTLMDAVVTELNKAQTPDLVRLQTDLVSLRKQLKETNESLKDAKKVLESERIPASLQRFDDAFHALLASQNIRWLAFEWLLPLLIGGMAICLLSYKIFITI